MQESRGGALRDRALGSSGGLGARRGIENSEKEQGARPGLEVGKELRGLEVEKGPQDLELSPGWGPKGRQTWMRVMAG